MNSPHRRLIIVTGMSGAGKSQTLKAFEDMGFETMDNVPLRFVAALAAQPPGEGYRGLVVGLDVRSRDFSPENFSELNKAVKNLQGETLFLDCDDETLRRRFTETRHKHPLAHDRPVLDGIQSERRMLSPIKAEAQWVIDTSELSLADLKQLLKQRLGGEVGGLNVQVLSFSYRHGLPRDADLVFDVRFLRNPHYDPALRPLFGTDPAVSRYIEEDGAFAAFYAQFTGMLLPLMPRYLAEGKGYLTIAFGCTGGKHRSVHLAQKLAGFLEQKGYKTSLRHRDLPRPHPASA